MERPAYDRIGRGYTANRRADPRIAAAVEAALGGAQSVLNVGAGAGSYEPPDRQVTAIEPSAAMIAQRPPGAAPTMQAQAEALPFADGSFDAVMAILSDHHWRDRATGLREMRRVARERVVLLNVDPSLIERFWLTRDYLPGLAGLIPDEYRQAGHWQRDLSDLLGGVEVSIVPVPHDCHDGFYQAYWRRPHAYLEPRVRDSISVFHRLDPGEISGAIAQLQRDLEDGTWEKRHGGLLAEPELDVGLRLAIATPT